MVRYGVVVALVLFCFLALFLAADQLGLEDQLIAATLSSPSEIEGPASLVGAALVSIGLLSADVILPIPASLIMVLNGALFGLALGTLVSFVGGLCAGWLGFALGRMGSPWVSRVVTPADAQRINHLLAKWGLLAVILTRPVPLLAETTALMAGASPISWWGMTVALALGALPTALLYAMTGAAVWALNSATLSVVLVVSVTALFWIFQHWRSTSASAISENPADGGAIREVVTGTE